MADLLRPQDLDQIAYDAEMAKFDEERNAKKKKEQQARDLREAFMSRELHPEMKERVNAAIRRAAEQCQRQLQVVTFPANYCNDGGRRINNFDPDWPSSLEGFAKKAYEAYEKDLRPLGYKLHAEVISFPGGVPGEIAMILKW